MEASGYTCCLKYIDFILFIGTNERVSKQKSVAKKSWSKGEEAIILKVFEKHFKSTSLPGKAEYQKAQKEYPIFPSRPWDHLKHKVSNFELEIQWQSTKGNLISKNLSKGKRKRKWTEMPLDKKFLNMVK